MPVTTIEAHEQSWPLDKPFRISRGARTEARVVVVTVTDGQHIGRGEAVPIRRYNQSPASVLTQIESIKSRQSFDRQQIQKLLPAGAARNALDCAFWDLEAKISGKRAWELAKIPLVHEVETSFTISLDTPAAMAGVAKANAIAPILKLKLGGDDLDLARVEAVHGTAPAARLLLDANESWTPHYYRKVVPFLPAPPITLTSMVRYSSPATVIIQCHITMAESASLLGNCGVKPSFAFRPRPVATPAPSRPGGGRRRQGRTSSRVRADE